MKIKELNKEILKLYYQENSKLYVEKMMDKIFVSDSYVVWIVPENDFIFDIEKFKSAGIFRLVDSVLDKNLIDGLLTFDFKKENKEIYRYIISEDQTIKVALNDKNLKCFESSCTFKIVDDHTPVLVYGNEELVGMICPVKGY